FRHSAAGRRPCRYFPRPPGSLPGPGRSLAFWVGTTRKWSRSGLRCAFSRQPQNRAQITPGPPDWAAPVPPELLRASGGETVEAVGLRRVLRHENRAVARAEPVSSRTPRNRAWGVRRRRRLEEPDPERRPNRFGDPLGVLVVGVPADRRHLLAGPDDAEREVR